MTLLRSPRTSTSSQVRFQTRAAPDRPPECAILPHTTGNPYVYELYHNLLELLEAQGRPRHGVRARLIKYVEVPDELMHDPGAAFRHIAADAERQVGG